MDDSSDEGNLVRVSCRGYPGSSSRGVKHAKVLVP